MTKRTRIAGLVVALGLAGLLAGTTGADESDSGKKASTSAIAGVPIFAPPNSDAPSTRVGGATRGSSRADLNGVEALVPEKPGFTLEAQPSLYWYVPRETPGKAEVLLIAANAREPMLEATLTGPFPAGAQRIRLADHDLTLAPGVLHHWTVTVIPDPERRAAARVVGGAIERVEPSSELTAELKAASPERTPFVLAEAGIWYDAVDVLSQRIAAAPDDAATREQRAALLEQVGLEGIAGAERAR